PSAVLDPTAGSGSLLAPFTPTARFGVEIDVDHAGGSELAGTEYEAVAGDAQDVVPMLRAAGLTWPAVVLNPPFGLPWRDAAHSEKEISSTTLSLLWGLDLISLFGQGALVCGTERLAREVLGHPDSRAIYAVADVEGPLFDGVSLPVSIAFFLSRDNLGSQAGSPLRLSARAGELSTLVDTIQGAREQACTYQVNGRYPGPDELAEPFAAAGKEHAERVKDAAAARPHHDISLKNGRVHVSPSVFAQMGLAKKHRLTEIRGLHRHNPTYFGQNGRAWRELEGYAKDGLLTLSPALQTAAAAAMEEAEKISTPLFPVPPVMRLGWLSDLDSIRCIQDDPEKGFVSGEDYSLSTGSKVLESTEKRVVENRVGDHELRRFTRQRKVLRVRIGGHHFDESNESIEYIAQHFHLPDPGCVATRFPEKVARCRAVLDDISGENSFSLYGYQADHDSRVLTKGRGLLAHDPGTGKTIQGMCLAEANPRIHGGPKQALFVIPQDLILQWQESAEGFFGRTLEVIKSPAHAREVARRVRAGEEGWWLVHYEMLSRVGSKDEDLPVAYLDPRADLSDRLAAYKRRKRLKAGEDPDTVSRAPLALALRNTKEPSRATTRYACPSCRADTRNGWSGTACRRCGYVHKKLRAKPAYAHLASAFKDAVKFIDELSEMRGDESLRSKALRAISQGSHVYGGTGTPISNYIQDIFWGLWATLGNATTAFPYDYYSKRSFEDDFATIEYAHGRPEDGEEHLRKRRKVLPEVTNVSQFWRLTQPSVSRCTKEQTGEPIVPKTEVPVRVPLGVGQREMVDFWLNKKNFADYFTWRNPHHRFVEEDLVEKYAASLGQLWRLEHAATLPGADEPTAEWPEAWDTLGEPSNFTPATLKVLEIAMKHAAQGEKVLIGSDLIQTGPWLAARLKEKGVNATHVTHERAGKIVTKDPRKRAKAVNDFKHGDAQVLCTGLKALRLGHDLHTASVAIVHGLDYSYDVMRQFVDRVHRLVSKKPVTVYVILPEGTIAEKKWDLVRDKGAASDLALDGEISATPQEPVDLSKVLRELQEKGIPVTGNEIPEEDVEDAWNQVPPHAPVLAPTAFTPAKPAAQEPDRPTVRSSQPAPDTPSG
ncbi:MAG: helicase-related protein, partial [Rubrobacteraceae bacterium]